MLSLVMFHDMNRSEQESLYRTSRKLSLVPLSQPTESRRSSTIQEPAYRNEGAYRRRSYIKEDFTPILTDCDLVGKEDTGQAVGGEDPPAYSEDLVLSVLKSPVNHSSYEIRESNCGCSSSEENGGNNGQEEER